MRAKIIEISHEKAVVVIEDSNPSLANALRRAVTSEVPIFAVDEVIFFENTTPFFDEYIAHRLAMIPLKTDLNIVRVDPERTVVLELNKEAKEPIEVIYSGDLESSDPLIVPANEKIPIIKMRKGQRIRLQAIARLGRGKDHSKWQPAAAIGYSYMPIYELDSSLKKDCDISPCEACIEEKKDVLLVNYPVKCPGCLEALERCRLDKPDKVKRKWDESKIILRYESTGSLSASDIFLEAVNQLKLKFSDFLNKVG